MRVFRIDLIFAICMTVLLGSLSLQSCKDDDVDVDACCGSTYNSSGKPFTLYIQSACTPDGDALNDYLQLAARKEFGVHYITSFTVKNEAGQQVYNADTLYNGDTDSQERWDFGRSSGTTQTGTFRLDFVVTDTTGQKHVETHRVCAFTCDQLSDAEKDEIRKECWFEDQIDIRQGFVNQTQEWLCK